MGWQDAPLAEAAPTEAPQAPKWQAAPLADAAPARKQFGIDWLRPIPEVRAEVAKLPESDRQDALKQWAEAYVAKEREGVKAMDLVPGAPGIGPNPKRIDDFVRSFAKGTIVGSFADEANALTEAAIHKLTGGSYGSPYDEAKAYQRALDEAIANEDPAGTVATQVTGSFSTGAPIAKKVLEKGKTVLGKTVLGGTVGGTAGYVAGFGEGEGDFWQRNENATSGEGRIFGASPVAAGLVIGATLPPTISGVGYTVNKLHDVASPTLARWGAQGEDLLKRKGILASADGSDPNIPVGAAAHAEQMIANQLARAGRSVDDLRNELGRVQDARRLDSNSYAPDATAIVDLDPSLQRLAGSASRASPEAANTATGFIRGRQTGITPSAGPDELARAGIPTRPMLSRPITGKEAERSLGTSFGAAQDDLVATGQGERIIDALKRAALIKDTKLHGLERNAYRTDQAIMDAARAEAQPAYAALYNAGRNVNIAPEVDAVLQKWQRGGARLANEAEDVVRLVENFANRFRPGGQPLSTIEKFDRTKQFMDARIEKYFDSPVGKNRYVGGILNELKNDLLAAVDKIKPAGIGDLYKETRGKWSSRMEAREALQAGRDAFRENSDIGVDAYRAITAGNEANKKLFLQGFVSAAEQKAKSMDRGADKTRIFAQPNIQELLSEILPRSKSGSAEFSNRPERFGQYLDTESRMVQTRNEVTGNSKTAERMKDDEAYNVMSKFGETVERFKSSATMTMVGVRAAEQMLGKLFGMRADAAAAIARQLFTANPADRARVLANVERRLGKNRAEHFSRLMEQYQRDVAAISARQGALPSFPETE
jgi:hypothetical protein